MSTKRIVQLLLILVVFVASFAATPTRAQAWSACGSTYRVQRGDWLAKIARKCGVTLADLYRANSWARYYHYIYPGQVLVIPGGYNNGNSACGPASDYYGSYYVVCHGDTLGGIALYYGVSIAYLRSHNNIPNANLIYPGQIIRP
jgi:lysozyme